MLQSRQEGCGETARVTPGHGNAKASSLHRVAADDDNPIQTKPGEKMTSGQTASQGMVFLKDAGEFFVGGGSLYGGILKSGEKLLIE